MKELKIRPLTEEERKYTYAQSTQLDGQTGNIGFLRGDFGSNGNQFFTTWTDRWDKYKTDVFRESLDDVVNTLRSGEYGLLQDRTAMTGYVTEVVDLTMKQHKINPEWVEWLMGFPIGWTDTGCGKKSRKE